MKSITVNILESKTNYNIFIGSDFIGDKLAQYEKEGAYFIIDSRVASFYKNIIPKERVFLFQASEKEVDAFLIYVCNILGNMGNYRLL